MGVGWVWQALARSCLRSGGCCGCGGCGGGFGCCQGGAGLGGVAAEAGELGDDDCPGLGGSVGVGGFTLGIGLRLRF